MALRDKLIIGAFALFLGAFALGVFAGNTSGPGQRGVMSDQTVEQDAQMRGGRPGGRGDMRRPGSDRQAPSQNPGNCQPPQGNENIQPPQGDDNSKSPADNTEDKSQEDSTEKDTQEGATKKEDKTTDGTSQDKTTQAKPDTNQGV